MDLQSDRDFEVIVTNIPHPMGRRTTLPTEDNPEILRASLAQWKIESIFGEGKSEFRADTVFFSSPEMGTPMLFCIGTAMLVRGMMCSYV